MKTRKLTLCQLRGGAKPLSFSSFLTYNIKVRHIKNSKLFTKFLYVFLM